MEKERQKVTCSKCGSDKMRIFTNTSGLLTECTECASTAEIVVVQEPPKIEFRYGIGSEGTLNEEKRG